MIVIAQIVEQLEKVTFSPHNLYGLSPAQLIKALVPLNAETSRLISGLSLAHFREPATEDEPSLIQPLGVRGAKGSTPPFELCAVPLEWAAVWRPEEGAVGRPAKIPIKGERKRGRERSGASDPTPAGVKLPAKRPKRGEPPAEWSAKNPPVSSPLMITKLNTLLPPRPFMSTPDFDLPRPIKLHWR